MRPCRGQESAVWPEIDVIHHFDMNALDPTRPVLIADDDEYFRLALGAIVCGQLGFATTVEAASLDEAFDVLATAEGRIDLALFDLRMPGMESPANLAAVRECHPDLRIAVVSAAQEREQILAALEAGVNGYVPKSFTPAELVRALKVVIGGDIFVPAFLAQVPAGDRISPQRLEARLAPPLPEVSDLMSPRQRQVLELVVKGYSNKQIASELSLAEGTVKVHVAAILRHLGVANRAAAAAAGAVLSRVL
jgi:DNA-binding NarL/FixJ family response regulator